VGLLTFSDQIEGFIPPRKGRNHVLRLIRDILAAPTQAKGTDIALALRTLNFTVKQRAIVFFLSDFLASPLEYERDLRVVAKHHDVIAVVMRDPLEMRWPDSGLVTVRDAETDTRQLVDSSSAMWRQAFEAQSRRFEHVRDDTLNRAGVDRITVDVAEDYVMALAQFFARRARRGR